MHEQGQGEVISVSTLRHCAVSAPLFGVVLCKDGI
jgi:hypothetical protein